MNDQVLYKTGPDEVIEYAILQDVYEGKTSETLWSETHHDVLVVLSGTGLVSWDGQQIPLNFGHPVVLPHSARYTLQSTPGHDLKVMIFGVAPRPSYIEEGI